MRKSSSNATLLPPILAALVGSMLFAAYLAPFYGALDRTVIDDGRSSIVVEDFDMPADLIDEESVPEAAPAPSAEPNTGQDERLGEALQRVEPREALSELGLAAPVTPPVSMSSETVVSLDAPEGSRVLHQSVAVAAGRLGYGAQQIELNGIEIIEPDAICTDIGGEAWPCGMQARTAFRGWLRNRSVTCVMSDADAAEQKLQTSCTLAGTDPARWLVENGWARAKFGSDYTDAQAQAEKALVGVFGRKPQVALRLPPAQITPNDPSALPDEGAAPQLPAENELPFPPAPQ